MTAQTNGRVDPDDLAGGAAAREPLDQLRELRERRERRDGDGAWQEPQRERRERRDGDGAWQEPQPLAWDFESDDDACRYLVDELIPRGNMVLFSADTGAGKSF